VEWSGVEWSVRRGMGLLAEQDLTPTGLASLFAGCAGRDTRADHVKSDILQDAGEPTV
jgi:hypothetical protein